MLPVEVLILSHRGYHVALPENTLDAFAAASSLGVDGFETDLRLTLDGELILFHDPALPDGREISRLTRASLNATLGYEVPTLAEALARWPGAFWDLEIKSPDAVPETLSLLSRRQFPGGLILTSFRHDIVAECLSQSDLNCGLLVERCPSSLSSLLGDFANDTRLKAIVWSYKALDEGMLREAADRGLKTFVYGADTVGEQRRLLSLPVDGIITDRPEFLIGNAAGN